MEADSSGHDSLPWYSGKTTARFLAVQGAYSMMFSSYSVEDLGELLEHLCEMRDVLGLAGRVDKKLLTKILESMLARHSEIDAKIAGYISEKWAMDRINLVSLSVMRTGVCELLCCNTSESIIINEYVDIASYTLEDAEVDFVNAVLNKAKLARLEHNAEMEAQLQQSCATVKKLLV
ncbi:transcription antitermination factor NusB [Anaplasma capra]|uniref:transcription antitermination factor NusB n=1 Tax=Anaplasma capra TaxID=1562740 RepID=UPI0021D595D3|nr:transcription antitermination factor NusB [Anaplasma capra]MCU7611459.1 transcription antitermination factor NusB [Anaplasma capra]MCU7612102.1 transcription antitermination factor NusB [Anaplasma capra]